MDSSSERPAAPPKGSGTSRARDRLRSLGLGSARSLYRWALIGILVGIVAGLTAVAFYGALQWASGLLLEGLVGIQLPSNGAPPGAAYSWSTDPARFYLLPLVMVGGGLAAGLLIYLGAPEIEGHGTDQTIRAFHRGGGLVRFRVPPLKAVASLLTIGSGGSGGREGPTAQIGSGLGSFVARPLRLSTQERRVAMMAGVGAGIGAIFKAPFGAALLSSEVLYLSDFEPEVIMPSIIASVVSYSIFGAYDGFAPEFASPAFRWSPEQLPVFALLGGIAGLLGILYVVTFYRVRTAFRSSGLPHWLRPAVGAGLSGGMLVVLYYGLPQAHHLAAVSAVGIGYGIVQWLLFQGHPTVWLLAIVVGVIFVKMVATSLTIGSGGSAGLFGPAIVLGALVGFASIGAVDLVAPGLSTPGDVAAFAVIGMMSFFGSVSKAPIATILMVVEMTGSETLLVPAMVAIFIGYYVAGRYHLYEEQVQNRLASPAHTLEYFSEFLRHMPVTAALRSDLTTVAPTASVSEAEFALSRSSHPLLAVVDHGRLVGEVRLADLLQVLPVQRSLTTVRNVMRDSFPGVPPEANLLDAVGIMDAESVDAVLVTGGTAGEVAQGVVTRESVARFQRSPGAVS